MKESDLQKQQQQHQTFFFKTIFRLIFLLVEQSKNG